MREQRPRTRLNAEARSDIGVTNTAAHLDARPCLRVAAVVAKPEIEPRLQHRALAERERAAAFQDDPQPARIRLRVPLVGDLLPLALCKERIRPDRNIEAARLVGAKQRAPRAERAEPHLDVGLRHLPGAAPGRRLRHGHLAGAVAEQDPGRDPLGHIEARIGVHAGERALDAPPPDLGIRIAPLALAQRHRHTRQPAALRGVRAEDAGGHLAIHAHGAVVGLVLAVEAARRHPAPGREARAAGFPAVRGQVERASEQ